MLKQKLLIIDKTTFGGCVDVYKRCEYLRDFYDIQVICFESIVFDVLNMDGVRVHCVSSRGNRIVRGIRYILYISWFLLFYNGKIMVMHFPKCSVLKKIFFWKKMILDIRSLGVFDDLEKNRVFDTELQKCCDVYDHVVLISEGVRNKLHIDIAKTSIIPLGSDIMSQELKQFSSLNLLYVGTFTNRNLDITLKGLAKYISETNDKTIHYHIVGDGEGDILERMKKIAYEELSLNENVTFYGRVPHYQLIPFFDKCNVGVSFVPMTEYYEHQPPTKTYEYVLSGLYCIATNTYANRCIINGDNGILINDSCTSFADALFMVKENMCNFDSVKIRNTLLDFTWKNIVNNVVCDVLNKI